MVEALDVSRQTTKVEDGTSCRTSRGKSLQILSISVQELRETESGRPTDPRYKIYRVGRPGLGASNHQEEQTIGTDIYLVIIQALE